MPESYATRAPSREGAEDVVALIVAPPVSSASTANEPRLGRAVALACGLPTRRELEEISERWRPYRTWVSLHLRAMLEEEMGR